VELTLAGASIALASPRSRFGGFAYAMMFRDLGPGGLSGIASGD
jgi:hypothetical protein